MKKCSSVICHQNVRLESAVESGSEVTIEDMKSSFLDKDSFLREALTRYTVEERKHLIIDHASGQIIDSRDQQGLEELFNKTLYPKKHQNGISYNFQNIFDYQAETNTDPWEQHWAESDKIHQQLLSSICNNDLLTFSKLMNRNGHILPLNVNYKSFDDWAPIHYASMKGDMDIFKTLLENKTLRLNSKTKFGQNALHIAVNANKVDICRILVDSEINVNEQDKDSNTPLHYATQFGYKDIIEMLISAGADLFITNHQGHTAKNLCTSPDLMKLFPEDNRLDAELLKNLFRNRRLQYVQNILDAVSCSAPKQIQSPSRNKIITISRKDSKMSFSPQPKKKSKSREKVDRLATGRRGNIARMYQLLKQNSFVNPIFITDFKFYKKIGEGAFGEVYVVKKQNCDKFYALKAMKKEKLMKTSLYKYIHTEKDVLALINHPFIVKLRYAFQTETYLFLVMNYCEGGDLGRLLQRKKKLDQKTTRAYACEILLALEALHKNMIIYRDLKPENVVIDKEGHVLLTDFGLSKKTTDLDALNKSFCGTPAYLPVEIVEKKGHTRMADWYEFGVVLYEMMVGIPPFYAENRKELFKNIRNGIIKFPRSTPQVFRSLIRQLLNPNPERRLGFQKDAQSVRQHAWFQGVDWTQVYERKLQVPPVQKKIVIGSEPIRCKFQDIKSEKYDVPSWTFIQNSQ